MKFEKGAAVVTRRPDGVSDATVRAVGKASEASEYLIRARGALYEFHQLMGHADLLLGDAVDALAEAGHDDDAHRMETDVVGRNVLDGRWTFQVVEEFDDLYYRPIQDHLRELEARLMQGSRHVFESELKENRRTSSRPGQEHRPPRAWSPLVETDPDRDT
jgi:hypothetical protein